LNKHHPTGKSRRFLRKRQVAARYGVDERTVDRMTRDGRLPPYIYLPGSRLPLQDEDELDERDDAAAAARTSNKQAKVVTAAEHTETTA
jgi:predicted DNA-binding transcriptional regulator AlpA